MYRIKNKRKLNETVTEMDIFAPLVAAKARAGQFVILRVDGDGERIPLTIAGWDRAKGLVKIVFQTVGSTTLRLSQKEAGGEIADFVGPLGRESETAGLKKVCVVGGGVAAAIALPLARTLFDEGADVTAIVGFRSKAQVILEEEFSRSAARLYLTTDDGSYAEKGNVTTPLKRLLDGGARFDAIFASGPLVMMKGVVETVRPFGIPVTVSMNPIMIDGTGMCGGCRLTLISDGKRQMKFACVDGPDFDGYAVDFDEAIVRNKMYTNFERAAYERACRLFQGNK